MFNLKFIFSREECPRSPYFIMRKKKIAILPHQNTKKMKRTNRKIIA